jgi:uncharacterized RDD family membrane protein YckC
MSVGAASVTAAAVPAPQARSLAGFWRRLAAWVIDTWLIFVAFVVIDLVFSALTKGKGDPFTFSSFAVVYFVYFTYLWGARGQTVGYMLMRIRLATRHGGPVGYGRAFLRALLLIPSVALCLVPAVVSLLTVAVDQHKRALHDMILGTRVARLR